MLTSALAALSDRLDSKFLTAYWLPAFMATLGSCGILAVLVGPEQSEDWVFELDSVEQTLAVLIIVLAITMGAFVLRALSRPIAAAFAGDALPRVVAEWSTRGQVRVKASVARALGVDGQRQTEVASTQQTRQWLNRAYPLDDAQMRPTRFGNVLATAVEHPWLAYAMDGQVWWPRLSPLLPTAFQDLLGGAQAPMMGLLNLSVVFTALALGGAAAFGLAGGLWLAAIVTLASGATLAWLCYRAGVSQAMELASLLRVGFDLYRHDILRQLDEEAPADLAVERALWLQMTAEVLGLPESRLTSEAAPLPAADAEAPAAETSGGAGE